MWNDAWLWFAIGRRNDQYLYQMIENWGDILRRDPSIDPKPFSSSFFVQFFWQKKEKCFIRGSLTKLVCGSGPLSVKTRCIQLKIPLFCLYQKGHSNLIKYTPIYPPGVRISQKVGTRSLQRLSDFPESVLTSGNGGIAGSSSRGFPENQKVMQWLFVPFFESPPRTTLRTQKISRKKTVSGSQGLGSSDRLLTLDFSHLEARFSCFLRVLQEARAFGLYCCNDKPLLYAKIFSFFFFANLDIYNTFLDEKKVTFF